MFSIVSKEEVVDKCSKEFESQMLKVLLQSPSEKMYQDEEQIKGV